MPKTRAQLAAWGAAAAAQNADRAVTRAQQTLAEAEEAKITADDELETVKAADKKARAAMLAATVAFQLDLGTGETPSPCRRRESLPCDP